MAIKKQTAASSFEALSALKATYLRNPSTLLLTTIENLERKAISLLDSEMILKNRDFDDKNIGSDWWELAKKQYPITQNELGEYVVRSEIRFWEEEKEWTFNYIFLAKQKVVQLVKWLEENRKRGYGDIESDLEKFHEKAQFKSDFPSTCIGHIAV